jgi:hypothetical protein
VREGSEGPAGRCQTYRGYSNSPGTLLIKSESRDTAVDGRSRKMGTSGPSDRNKTERRYPMTDRKRWDLWWD